MGIQALPQAEIDALSDMMDQMEPGVNAGDNQPDDSSEMSKDALQEDAAPPLDATEQTELATDSDGVEPTQDEVISRVGNLTRVLHDSLRGLGLDKSLEMVTHEIPDARDRLNYVLQMTEQAAQKVLNATDAALPLQADISTGAHDLQEEWKNMMAQPSLKSEYNQLAEKTIAYLEQSERDANASKDYMMEIMMAQDFQDLTGQVIKRVTSLAQELEQQLIQVLIDFNPAAKKEKENDSLMNGPQINPEDTENALAGQEEVDDLLDSLGF